MARRATTLNSIRSAITRPAPLWPPDTTVRQVTRLSPEFQSLPPTPSARSFHQPIGAPAVLTEGCAPAVIIIVAAYPCAAHGRPAITRGEKRGSRLHLRPPQMSPS